MLALLVFSMRTNWPFIVIPFLFSTCDFDALSKIIAIFCNPRFLPLIFREILLFLQFAPANFVLPLLMTSIHHTRVTRM